MKEKRSTSANVALGLITLAFIIVVLLICCGKIGGEARNSAPQRSSEQQTSEQEEESSEATEPNASTPVVAPEIGSLDPSLVPEDVRTGVPYRGMRLSYLSSTSLGPYDEAMMVRGTAHYVWYCTWDPDRIACIVVVENNKVIIAIVYNGLIGNPRDESPQEPESPAATVPAEEMPAPESEPAPKPEPAPTQERSSEPAHSEEPTSDVPLSPAPDPYDYDEPEDYADAYVQWATANGLDTHNAYDNAYDKWIDEVGEEGWDEW